MIYGDRMFKYDEEKRVFLNWRKDNPSAPIYYYYTMVLKSKYPCLKTLYLWAKNKR